MLNDNSPVYIYRSAAFVQTADEPRAPLKEKLKAAGCGSLRRSGRFNQLAVLAARLCCTDYPLPESSDIILSTFNGSVGVTVGALDEIFEHQQLPMPFNFMNTQINSACFYVAREFAINGSHLVCSHHDAPLEAAIAMALAQWSSSNGKATLVGLADDWTLDHYHSPSGYIPGHTDDSLEGACWFLLGPRQLDASPLAKIVEVHMDMTATQLPGLLEKYSSRLKQIELKIDQQTSHHLPEDIPASLIKINDHAPALREAEEMVNWINHGEHGLYCRIRSNQNGKLRIILLDRSA